MIFIIKKIKGLLNKISKSSSTHEKIYKACGFSILLNIFFGTLFYFFERDVQKELTYLDSLWWSMVTMTTVGYGDFFAKTNLGRFFVSYPCMLIGIGVIGYLVGIVAESVVEKTSKTKKGFMTIKEEKHLIICNYPGLEKIKNILSELRAGNRYRDTPIVLITDAFDEFPDFLKKLDLKFVKGSPIDEETLVRAGITNCSGVFILAEDPTSPASDERSFAIGTIIEMIEKENDVPIKTIVELVDQGHQKLMKRSKVDGMISTDGITGCLLVQEFLYPGVNDIFRQVISNTVGSQIYIFDTRLSGYKVYDVQLAVLEHEENLQVIGIIKGGKQILNPSKNILIEEEDQLIMLAENRKDFRLIEEDILKKGENS